jgi:type VI secretion system secreted protein Hcp
MPQPITATFKDSGGNKIKGGVQVAGREEDVDVLEFDHSINIPVDTQKGELQGIREHEAATLWKPVDRATPMLYKALTNGETLKEIVFHWYHIDKSGTETEYFTLTLENAKIADMTTVSPDRQDPRNKDLDHRDKVSLLYEKITWKITDGNIESSDAWKEER